MKQVLGLAVALLAGPALYDLCAPEVEPMIGRFFAPHASEHFQLVGLISCLFIVNLSVQLFLTLVWEFRLTALALAIAFYVIH